MPNRQVADEARPPADLPWDDQRIEQETRNAIATLWRARRAAGAKDKGVTEGDPVEEVIQELEDHPEKAEAADDTRGGKHLDGFCRVLTEVATLAGYEAGRNVRSAKRVELPGYFRVTKKWDLIVVKGEELLAAIELKSMGGSYGKNFNNRTEEAMGSATDLRTAITKGLIGGTPWLGYIYVIREDEVSTRKAKNDFTAALEVDDVFQKTSYVERYGTFCERLRVSGLYDGTAYLVSPRGSTAEDNTGLNVDGLFSEPLPNDNMRNFLRSFYRHLIRLR
jgi:hypothetical protein